MHDDVSHNAQVMVSDTFKWNWHSRLRACYKWGETTNLLPLARENFDDDSGVTAVKQFSVKDSLLTGDWCLKPQDRQNICQHSRKCYLLYFIAVHVKAICTMSISTSLRIGSQLLIYWYCYQSRDTFC